MNGRAREIQVRRRDDVTEADLIGGVEKRELFLAEHDTAWASEYAAHEGSCANRGWGHRG